MTTTSAETPRLSKKQTGAMLVATRKLKLEPSMSDRQDGAYRIDSNGKLWTSVTGNANTFRSLRRRGLIRWIPMGSDAFRSWVRLTDAGWSYAYDQGWAAPPDRTEEDVAVGMAQLGPVRP